MTCLNKETLMRYLCGELLPEQRNGVELHLANCHDCSQLEKGFRSVQSELDEYGQFVRSKAYLRERIRCSIEELATEASPAVAQSHSEEDSEAVGSVTPAFAERMYKWARKMGSQSRDAAFRAFDRFLQSRSVRRDEVNALLRQLTRRLASPGETRFLDAILQSGDPQAEIVGYYEQTDEVLPTEACRSLTAPSTRLATLVVTRHRQIYLATVDPTEFPNGKRFKGFSLRLSQECYVMVVSGDVPPHRELPEVLHHELRETYEFMKRTATQTAQEESDMGEPDAHPQDTKESAHSREARDEKVAAVSFAKKQAEADKADKIAVASWVAFHLQLRDGAGIVIDSGSSCLKMWEETVKGITRGDYSFLKVFTNNFPVLQYWSEHYVDKGVRTTDVQLVGNELDWEHLAFFSREGVKKLMDPGFRAMNVCIGASGIAFDVRHRCIRLTYHDSNERVFKEHLFKCRADRRLILGTPQKIGFTGASSFDILDIDSDNDAPIYLVTTAPREKGNAYDEFERMKKAFQSEELSEAVKAKDMTFHWIILNKNGKEEHLVLPKGASKNIV